MDRSTNEEGHGSSPNVPPVDKRTLGTPKASKDLKAVTPSPPKLSGAGRKRMKFLIKAGLPAEEARKLAFIPLPPKVFKSGNSTRKVKSAGSETKKRASSLGGKRDATEPKRAKTKVVQASNTQVTAPERTKTENVQASNECAKAEIERVSNTRAKDPERSKTELQASNTQVTEPEHAKTEAVQASNTQVTAPEHTKTENVQASNECAKAEIERVSNTQAKDPECAKTELQASNTQVTEPEHAKTKIVQASNIKDAEPECAKAKVTSSTKKLESAGSETKKRARSGEDEPEATEPKRAKEPEGAEGQVIRKVEIACLETKKRSRSGDGEPEATEPKHAKTQAPNIQPKESEEIVQASNSPHQKHVQNFTQTNSDLRVAIMHRKYPEQLLKMDQMKAIEEAILDKILELGSDATVTPRFQQIHACQGWLVLTCYDKATFEWLLGLDLKPWEGAELKVAREEELHDILIGHLPSSQDYSNEKILALIEAQNGLNARNWRIVSRTPLGSLLQVTISADEKSVKTLKKANFRINYKFSQIQFKLKGGQETAEASLLNESSAVEEETDDLLENETGSSLGGEATHCLIHPAAGGL